MYSVNQIIQLFKVFISSCIYKDLPALQEILLQINALAGKESEDCSLILRSDHCIEIINIDLPALCKIRSKGFSFVNPRAVVFESRL